MVLNDERIEEAAYALLEAAPGSQVVLFGSYARGTAQQDSDLDFLVVEPRVNARRAEMIRLAEVLRSRGIHADVLVLSSEQFNDWRDVPGSVVYDAAREGRVFRGSS